MGLTAILVDTRSLAGAACPAKVETRAVAKMAVFALTAGDFPALE